MNMIMKVCSWILETNSIVRKSVSFQPLSRNYTQLICLLFLGELFLTNQLLSYLCSACQMRHMLVYWFSVNNVRVF